MPVTIIIGGQFGSEGKGKTAHYFSKIQNAQIAVRVGGSNSGHTVINKLGKPIIFRHLPTASILNNVICIIPAGSYINFHVLLKELSITSLTPDRLLIDPNAMVITEEDINSENICGLTDSIGSTASGTGSSVLRRVQRKKDVLLASKYKNLEPYIKPVIPFLRSALKNNERIIIEGTQGYGLSLLHSRFYPYVTSRDTSAAGFLSETGLSPLDVDEIVMVLRTFPIRVAGNSGPLVNEINWEKVSKISGSGKHIKEYTSVTKKIRRVGKFDATIVKEAIAANNPTKIVLNHVDYFDHECSIIGCTTERVEEKLNTIEKNIGRKIDFFGLSPSTIVSKDEIFLHKTIQGAKYEFNYAR